jgi:putative FmdB family regulatory protein
MPMFEYRCPMCNQHFERLTDDGHKDEQRHYPCGVVAARLPSAPAFNVTGYNAKNRYTDRRLFAVQPDGSTEKK